MTFRLTDRFWRWIRVAVAALLTGCAGNPQVAEVQLASDSEEILIRDLYCSRSGSLVAVGNIGALQTQGVALYSDDRGGTWRKAAIDPAPEGVSLSLVQMPSPTGAPQLYVAGYRDKAPGPAEPGPWWISPDGGRSWRDGEPKLPLGARQALRFGPKRAPEVAVADASGILVAVIAEGDGVFVLRSTDWGGDWDKRRLPMPRDFASRVVTDERGHLAFFGRSLPRHPLDDDIGRVYWSADAGATWHEAPEGAALPPSMRLFMSPTGTMIASNASPRTRGDTLVFRSTDHGRTWERAPVGDAGVIIGIAGNGQGRLVAVTEFLSLLLSDDDGATWRNGRLPAFHFTRSFERSFTWTTAPVAFLGERVVIAAIGNRILRSSDGGETWTVVGPGPAVREYRWTELCADGKGLVVAGGEGMIARSLDWGLTWQRGKME